MNIAGHAITPKQLAALHGLYQGLVEVAPGGKRTVYGVNVKPQLDALAGKGIIRSDGWSYVIPYDSPGGDIIAATPDFTISMHL